MKPRIGFVLEQALGHVAYGMESPPSALGPVNDIESEWLEVSFDEEGFGQVPIVGKSYVLRGNVSGAKRDRAPLTAGDRSMRSSCIRSMIGLLAMDYISKDSDRCLSLDADPVELRRAGRMVMGTGRRTPQSSVASSSCNRARPWRRALDG